MDVNTALAALSEAFANTPEFNELKNARLLVGKNSSYDRLLKEFEDKQDKLNSDTISYANMDHLVRELQNDYHEISGIPEINAFFAASANFNNMFNGAIHAVRTRIDKYIN